MPHRSSRGSVILLGFLIRDFTKKETGKPFHPITSEFCLLTSRRLRLEQIYQKTVGEIQAVLRNPANTRHDAGLDKQPQLPKENRAANSWQSDIPKRPAAPVQVLSAVSAVQAQPRDRIHRKDQMQLSTQIPDVPPSTAPSGQPSATPSGLSPVGSSSQPSW